MAVIAAGKLDDLVPARDAAGEAQHGHGRLGTRVHQADLLNGHSIDDLRSKINFGDGRCTVRGSALRRLGHGADDLRMGVTEQHRPPRAHQVHQLIAVDVVEVRAAGPGDEPRRTAD